MTKLACWIRNLIFWGGVVSLTGCIYTDESIPKIIYDYPVEALPSPADVRSSGDFADTDRDAPWDWLPASHLKKKWTAVVIHHSGTDTGNAAIFDKWHRQGRHWEGVGYDFVIGNGTDSGDGQIEVTFRWREQKVGAHCGGTPGNWANKDAVGICLVGNFNKTLPTTKQMESLVKLIKFLQRRYGISTSRIYGHSDTPGARVTDCPGKKFSIERLRQALEH